MKRDDFLDELTKKIKSKKVKKNIRLELNFHLNESKKQWIDKGFTDAEAEEKAVHQMGNPTKIGHDLCKLHCPKPILYIKPLMIHVFVSLIAAIIFNVTGNFEQLMNHDTLWNIGNGLITIFILSIYIFLGKKSLKGLSNNLLIKSLAIIFAINLLLGISGYLMTNLGSGIVAENGQLPIVIFMLFNYGFYSMFASYSVLPEFLSILLFCIISPFLLYMGSRINNKIFE